MFKKPYILAVNPGSTSTKFAVFHGKQVVFKETIKHQDEELSQFATIADQLDYRFHLLIDALDKHEIALQKLDAVVGRGGFVKPLPSGTYIVDDMMVKDVKTARFGEHASNLGPMIAYELAKQHDLPAYIVDPVVVDEMEDVARLSGIPDIDRKSHIHALNIKAVSRTVAHELGKSHTDLNFVVAHLGGGISVVAHRKGRIIDVNNANDEGPYSPERAGGLPSYQLAKLCYSGKYSEKEMLAKLAKEGGFYAYLGTRNAMEVEERARQGDRKAIIVLDGMIYQIAKEIGSMAVVLDGDVDGIILTGGLSHSDYIVQAIKKKVQFISQVYVVPGEEELEALALGALRVLLGEEQAKKYAESVLI